MLYDNVSFISIDDIPHCHSRTLVPLHLVRRTPSNNCFFEVCVGCGCFACCSCGFKSVVEVGFKTQNKMASSGYKYRIDSFQG